MTSRVAGYFLPIGKDLEPIHVATQSNIENFNGEAARRDTETAQVSPATVPMSADYDDFVITYCHSWRTLSVTHRHLFACISGRIAFVSPLTFHYRTLPVQSKINRSSSHRKTAHNSLMRQNIC